MSYCASSWVCPYFDVFNSPLMHHYSSRGAFVSKTVTTSAYQVYEKHINQLIQALQDPSAKSFLGLIMEMTQYNANKRVSASVALSNVAKLREGRQGRIMLKSNKKTAPRRTVMALS